MCNCSMNTLYVLFLVKNTNKQILVFKCGNKHEKELPTINTQTLYNCVCLCISRSKENEVWLFFFKFYMQYFIASVYYCIFNYISQLLSNIVAGYISYIKKNI